MRSPRAHGRPLHTAGSAVMRVMSDCTRLTILRSPSPVTPFPARYSPYVISKRTAVTWPLPEAEVERAIRAMVRRVVDQFDPEQVILFGSRARGDARPDSDVDLLVVMPVEGSTREKAIEIRVALHDIPVPKDVAVATPESFAWRKNVVGTVEWPAAHEGKVLHGRKR